MNSNIQTAEIRRRVDELRPWYHNLNLRGIQTAPDHFLGDYPAAFFRHFAHALPSDLRGQTVLDVGCNAGFFSLEMKRRGADRVVGIDPDARYLAQARFVAGVSGLPVEFRKLSVYEVAALRERFDLVLFLGVLYHLRHPLLALDLLHTHVVGDLLVFQSMLRGSPDPSPAAGGSRGDHEDEQELREDVPRLYFIEQRYAGDPTNWWIPDQACAEAILRSAGFDILERPDTEIFICRRRLPRSATELLRRSS